jgi:hypothetical protein
MKNLIFLHIRDIYVRSLGQANIVFSSSISVADAIRAASELKADLKFSEVEPSFVDIPDM